MSIISSNAHARRTERKSSSSEEDGEADDGKARADRKSNSNEEDSEAGSSKARAERKSNSGEEDDEEATLQSEFNDLTTVMNIHCSRLLLYFAGLMVRRYQKLQGFLHSLLSACALWITGLRGTITMGPSFSSPKCPVISFPYFFPIFLYSIFLFIPLS